MRRFTFAFVALFPVFALHPAAAAIATNAEHAILMDGDSGQVLWAKDAFTPMPPASMSKLMTIELVFKELKDGRIKPGDLVIIPKGTPHGGTKPDGRTIKAIAIKTPPQAPDDMKLLN